MRYLMCLSITYQFAVEGLFDQLRWQKLYLDAHQCILLACTFGPLYSFHWDRKVGLNRSMPLPALTHPSQWGNTASFQSSHSRLPRSRLFQH